MKLISMSVFGNDVRYVGGAVENAELVQDVYPGWTLRIYVESGHAVIPLLHARGVEIVEVEVTTGTTALRYWHTMTRFHAAADPRAECVVFRDADSRVNVREAAAVAEWWQTGRALHVMRDHPLHQLPMLAGMWGVRGGYLERIVEWISGWRTQAGRRGVDQEFLAELVYPAFAEAERWEHSACAASPGRPFPPHPPYEGFVGEIMPVSPVTARLVREATGDHRPRRRACVRSAELDGEMLLYDPLRKAAIRLNESAATVWRLCDGSRSLAELTALVGEAYPEPGSVAAEAEAAVHQLVSEGSVDLAMRRFAVYSSDPADSYAFLLPIAAVAWARMGYVPISLLYGSRDLWRSDPKTALILELIEPISVVRHVAPVPGWSVPTIAACCRPFAAALPDVEDDDYVLTSDVDLVPLDRAFFNQLDCSRSFSLLNADGYGDFRVSMPGRFPLCHVGGRARHWRDLLGINTTDIDLEIARSSAAWVDRWGQDELYVSGKLHAHPCFQGPLEKESANSYRKGDCQLLTRTFVNRIAVRRMDRVVDWNYSGARDLIDCHAHRPAYERIDPLVGVLAAYFPSDVPFFRSYFSDFLRLKERELRIAASGNGGDDGHADRDAPVRAGLGVSRRSRGRARTRTIAFAGTSISIQYEPAGEALVHRLFHALPAPRRAAVRSLVRVGNGRDPESLAVHCDDELVYEGSCRETAAYCVLDAVQRRLAEQSRGGALLHAAAVSRDGRAILLPGPSGAGKSSLAAWFARNGFDLLGDEAAFIRRGRTHVEGFTTPVTIKEAGRSVLDGLLGVDTAAAANPSSRLLIAPEQLNPRSVPTPAKLALLLFPHYEAAAELELVALSKADAAKRLFSAVANGSALGDGGFEEVVRLATMMPAYALRYSDFAWIGTAIEPLLAARLGHERHSRTARF